MFKQVSSVIAISAFFATACTEQSENSGLASDMAKGKGKIDCGLIVYDNPAKTGDTTSSQKISVMQEAEAKFSFFESFASTTKKLQDPELNVEGDILVTSGVSVSSKNGEETPSYINIEVKQVIGEGLKSSAEVSIPYNFRGILHLRLGPIVSEKIEKLDLQCEITD